MSKPKTPFSFHLGKRPLSTFRSFTSHFLWKPFPFDNKGFKEPCRVSVLGQYFFLYYQSWQCYLPGPDVCQNEKRSKLQVHYGTASAFCESICIVCFSFLQPTKGAADGGYQQTDRLNRWLTPYPLPINLWLSPQLFLTCSSWHHHQPTPKPIWLGNSHRWWFIPRHAASSATY